MFNMFGNFLDPTNPAGAIIVPVMTILLLVLVYLESRKDGKYQ